MLSFLGIIREALSTITIELRNTFTLVKSKENEQLCSVITDLLVESSFPNCLFFSVYVVFIWLQLNTVQIYFKTMLPRIAARIGTCLGKCPCRDSLFWNNSLRNARVLTLHCTIMRNACAITDYVFWNTGIQNRLDTLPSHLVLVCQMRVPSSNNYFEIVFCKILVPSRIIAKQYSANAVCHLAYLCHRSLQFGCTRTGPRRTLPATDGNTRAKFASLHLYEPQWHWFVLVALRCVRNERGTRW